MNIIKKIFTFLWLPFVLLFFVIFFLIKITNFNDQQTFNVVFGIAIGVVLGFVADITRSKVDELQSWLQLRKIALKLLEEDAKKIYTTMELYKGALESKDKAPKELQEAIETHLPPKLEFRYWNRLNQNDNFLLLGSEEPFDKIFEDLWDFEIINQQIMLALKQNKQAYMFAMTMYRRALTDGLHKQLLRRFMSEKELESFEENWRKSRGTS